MNRIANFTPPAMPAPMSPELDEAVRWRLNRLDPHGRGWSIASADALDDATRDALRRRVNRIDAALSPMPAPLIEAEVGKLFVGLVPRASGDTEGEFTLDLYVRALSDLPANAISAACADFIRGTAGDRKWVPTAAQLRAQAECIAYPWHRERSGILRLLGAKVRPPPASAETIARVRELAARSLRGMREASQLDCGIAEADPLPTPAELVETLAAAYTAAPCGLSDEVRRKLGLDGAA